MRLLVITQAVDSEDTYLGFFVGWLTELAQHFDSIEAVCLKRGKATLPANVSVYSLGKEISRSRLRYVLRFYVHIWKLRNQYDAVFVHMNQEYVLLGALLWKMLGKKVYLWRNHQVGNAVTSLAVMLADKTFCTSQFSYIARYHKNALMPVGVDTDLFSPVPGVARKPRSILFFGRFAPSKRPDLLVEALTRLIGEWSASFVGSPLPKDSAYEADVRRRAQDAGLASRIAFLPGIAHTEAPALYASHDIYVNLATSGMYDKTIFEAAASGCIVLAASRDYGAHVRPMLRLEDVTAEELAEKLHALLGQSPEERRMMQSELSRLAEENSLHALGKRLHDSITAV